MSRFIEKTPLDSWINRKIDSKSDVLTRKNIEEYQLEKIRETISIVCDKSIFYRNQLKDFIGHEIYSLNDFRDFPFTDESNIGDNPLQMLCVSQSSIDRVVTLDSSGTTGSPKRIYFTREDQELTIDFFMQGMSTLTVKGDRVAILLPCERPGSVGDLLAYAIERLEAIPFKHGVVKNINGTLHMFSEENINVLVGIPVQVLALARFYELNNGHNVSIQRVLLSTDYASGAIVKELERIFGCEVFDHYGMTEMGLGGGIDCCSHGGYHLREADLYFEIVDHDSGKIVPEGNYGEVVFTTLTRNGMPLVRYRTGDISRFIPGDCPCGSGLQRMDYIWRRKNSSVIFDNCHYLDISDLDEALFTISGVVDFETVFIKNGRNRCLDFKIMSLYSSVKETEVLNQLYKIPSVFNAVQNGIIQIKTVITVSGTDYIPKTGKRKIYLVQPG